MASFVTQIEGDTMMVMEAETTGSYAKTSDEVRGNPMAAFDNAVNNAAVISRVMSHRLRMELAGTPVRTAEVGFGLKVTEKGSVMIAQEGTKAQFQVRLVIQVD